MAKQKCWTEIVKDDFTYLNYTSSAYGSRKEAAKDVRALRDFLNLTGRVR